MPTFLYFTYGTPATACLAKQCHVRTQDQTSKPQATEEERAHLTAEPPGQPQLFLYFYTICLVIWIMKHMRCFSLIFVCFSYILSLLLNSNSSYSLKHTKPRIRDGGMGWRGGWDRHKITRDQCSGWGPAMLHISKIPLLLKGTKCFPLRPKPILRDPDT